MENVKTYLDLLNQNSAIHAWKSVESFDISSLNNEERERLKNSVGIEIVFEGIDEKRYLFDSLFKKFDALVKSFTLISNASSYMYIAEFKKQLKNKVRSYKGVVPQAVDKNAYIQLEVSLEGNYTLIASLIKLNQNNINKLVDFFTDSSRCFIINSNQADFFSQETILSIVNNTMVHKSTSWINYAKLVAKYCPLGDIIYRAGGDGGDREVNFQVFCIKKKMDLMIIQAETILK